jgi:hypothetical protein
MEAWMVGPVILWVIVSLFLVKKKGRQWPDLLWGLVGGLVLSKVVKGIPDAVYSALDQIWNAVVSIFTAIFGGLG